ncbi:hypothetical protein EMCRGX_G012329 [Ephydatia muelleri]
MKTFRCMANQGDDDDSIVKHKLATTAVRDAMLCLTLVILLVGAVQGQFSLTSPPMGTYSCPGSNITYTCVLNSSDFGVITAWSGSAFQCPPTNQISLTQRVGGTVLPFPSGSCGSLYAVTTNVTSTCYTSVLIIPAVQALNGATVVCRDGSSLVVVGNNTLMIMTSSGPVGNMTVTSTSVDQLTVTWTAPSTGGVPTSYNVTINDSSSPVVIADNGSPVYTHTFTGLVSDTLYTVSVVAINCAGSSNRTSFVKRTRPAPPIRTSMQMVLVFNPNNTLRHLEISWIPVGGSVSVYTVRVVGDGGTSVGHGSPKCTTSPCLFVQQVNVPATSYTIFVASINGDGEEGPENNITVSGTNTSSSVWNCAISTNATMGCTFNQSFYCMVCCSTDPSVPPDSSVYNISTTRGTEVTVSLQGLTSGQMYYCKAAATNTNSTNCAGPVVGGVKVFFSFIPAGVNPSQMTTPPEGNRDAIIGGVVGSVVVCGIIIIIILLYWCSTSSYCTGEEEGGSRGERCAPIGGIEVVRAVKLGGVASRDRMEPSAVATNTQQATYAIPDLTKKASGCGLLLPWLPMWQGQSMADTPLPLPAPLKEGDDGPPPLPAPLKEGDNGPPVAIYALCEPPTDVDDVGVVIGCGYLHGLTTSFKVNTNDGLGSRMQVSMEMRLMMILHYQTIIFLGIHIGPLVLGIHIGPLALGIHIGPLALGIHIGPLALGIHIGPLVLGIHIGPLVLGIHIGPLVLDIHIGSLVLGIHIGSLALGIHIGPLVLGIHIGPLVLVIGPLALGIHIGPLAFGIHIGPLVLGIHIGPVVLGIHIGPLALGIHIGSLALGINIGPLVLALGIHIGSLVLGIHIGPLVLGIHIGPLALGIHIGPLVLGIHIGSLVLGIHIGPLVLGIHIGSLVLGIHIGPLVLGIHIGSLAVIYSQAREEIVNTYSIAVIG